jgi:hypothetical protein
MEERIFLRSTFTIQARMPTQIHLCVEAGQVRMLLLRLGDVKGYMKMK